MAFNDDFIEFNDNFMGFDSELMVSSFIWELIVFRGNLYSNGISWEFMGVFDGIPSDVKLGNDKSPNSMEVCSWKAHPTNW